MTRGLLAATQTEQSDPGGGDSRSGDGAMVPSGTVLRCSCGTPLLVILADGTLDIRRDGKRVIVRATQDDIVSVRCHRCGREFRR